MTHCLIGKITFKSPRSGAFGRTMVPARSGRGYVHQYFKRISELEWVPITLLEYVRSTR
jgi:hypothetical protein